MFIVVEANIDFDQGMVGYTHPTLVDKEAERENDQEIVDEITQFMK